MIKIVDSKSANTPILCMDTIQIESVKKDFDDEKDSSLLVTGGYLGKIKIFKYSSMKLLIQINSHCQLITCLDIDQKHLIIITGSEDTYLNVWQLHFNDTKIDQITLKGSYHLDDQKIVGTQAIL